MRERGERPLACGLGTRYNKRVRHSPLLEPAMTRRAIQLLTDGEAIDEVYMIADKQLRTNRNGSFFLQVELRDRTGAMSARLWNANEPQFRSFNEGDFLRIKGKVQLFQGALQVLFTAFERVEPSKVVLEEFVPRVEQDINKLYDRLRQHLLKLNDPHLRALAECFFIDDAFVAAFCQSPAGIRNHHAYVGGLLEHVVTMLDAADRIAPLYPELNREVLMMGVFLHDIGKTRELICDTVFGYSDEGQLIGHIDIGVEMLTEKVAKVPDLTGEPFPRELFLRLKHLIVSHHGSYEFGSPRLPMTPEAIALTYLDNLDAKLHSFLRDIREDRNAQSAWTPYNQSIQRRLFKGLREGSEPVAD
jgi:3'-5' exoribonuclease